MRLIIYAGLAVLVLAVAMAAVAGGSPAPVEPERHGFASAVVALELARSAADVEAAIGLPAEHAPLRTGTRRATYVDFAFLCSYALLTFSVSRRLWATGAISLSFHRLLALLALTMAAADAWENGQILKILDAAPADLHTFNFSGLIWSTHVKWYALFLSAAVLGLGYARLAGFGRLLLLATLYASAGAMGLLGLLFQPPLIEVAALVLALGWMGSLLHTLYLQRPA